MDVVMVGTKRAVAALFIAADAAIDTRTVDAVVVATMTNDIMLCFRNKVEQLNDYYLETRDSISV
jgi:hypothetical protein